MEQPLVRFRAGNVSCAVWENEAKINGQTRTLLNASIGRRYKDKNGEWKSSQSFSRNEIPLAVHCLQKAFEAIIDEDASRSVPEENVE